MKRLELLMLGDNEYTAVVDGLIARRLCIDEALGVVASALYRPDKRPPYTQSYEGYVAAEKARPAAYSEWREPVAMLPKPAPDAVSLRTAVEAMQDIEGGPEVAHREAEAVLLAYLRANGAHELAAAFLTAKGRFGFWYA